MCRLIKREQRCAYRIRHTSALIFAVVQAKKDFWRLFFTSQHVFRVRLVLRLLETCGQSYTEFPITHLSLARAILVFMENLATLPITAHALLFPLSSGWPVCQQNEQDWLAYTHGLLLSSKDGAGRQYQVTR